MTNKCHENYVTKESCNSLPGCIQYKCNSRMIVCSVDLHQQNIYGIVEQLDLKYKSLLNLHYIGGWGISGIRIRKSDVCW